MRSYVSAEFIEQLRRAPIYIRREAKRAYRLFRKNPDHPQLHFEPKRDKKSPLWTARIFNTGWRVVGLKKDGAMYWDFLGPHDAYMKELRKYK